MLLLQCDLPRQCGEYRIPLLEFDIFQKSDANTFRIAYI